MNEMPRVRGLKTDSTIRERLGPELLAELQANLWAIDCQTCNRPLGWRKPSLTVAASDDGLAEAALHHQRCQTPRWAAATRFPMFGSHQSWRSGGYAVQGTGVVVFLVNPACEVATLLAGDDGWRLANLEAFLIAGMERGWPDESPPLPGLTGSLDGGGTLTIDMEYDGNPVGRWSTPSLPAFAAEEIQRHDMVLVGVTTAIDVTTGIRPEVVQSLVDRGQIALAWASVTTPDIPDKPGEDVLPAVIAAVRGDGSLLAELRGDDRFHAVLQVATVFAGFSPPDGDQGDTVHIVVPDEPTGQRLTEWGRAVLEGFDRTLSAPASPGRSDVVIGTPEQFATRPRGAQLAIVMDVPAPPHPYERILAV